MADTKAALTLRLPGLQDPIGRLVHHAQARLDPDTDELTRQCERAIHIYVPCISCAAHFLDLTVDRP